MGLGVAPWDGGGDGITDGDGDGILFHALGVPIDGSYVGFGVHVAVGALRGAAGASVLSLKPGGTAVNLAHHGDLGAGDD